MDAAPGAPALPPPSAPAFSADQVETALNSNSAPLAQTPDTSVTPAQTASVPEKLPQAPAFATPDIDEALDSRNIDNSLALAATLRQASQQNPDQVAKAIPLANQLNLPVGTVQRNYNMLDQQQRFTQDYVDNLQKQFPNTAKWLKDPTNAAIAHDDIPALQTVEQSTRTIPQKIGDFVQGLPSMAAVTNAATDFSPTQLLLLSHKQGLGETTPEEDRQLEGLRENALTRDIVERQAGQSYASRSILGALGMAPMLSEVIKQGVAGAGVGASGGAILGLASPAEAVTVPAGATEGFTVGSTHAMWQIMSGQMREALMGVKDENGKPIDPAIASAVARDGGLLIAAANETGLGAVLNTIPGMSELTEKAIIQKLASSPSVSKQLADVAMRLMKATGGMGLAMGAQAGLTDVGQNIAQAMTGGDFKNKTMGDVAGDVYDNFKDALGMGFLLGLPGSALSVNHIMAHADQTPSAAETHGKIIALQQAVDASKTQVRSPDAMRGFLNSAMDDGDYYARPQAAQAFYQSLSPEERAALDAKMPEFSKSVADAVTQNSDIAINRADFHSYMGPLGPSKDLMKALREVPENWSAQDMADAQELMDALKPTADDENPAARENFISRLIQQYGQKPAWSGNIDIANKLGDLHGAAYNAFSNRYGHIPGAQDLIDRAYKDLIVQRNQSFIEQASKADDFDLNIDRARNLLKSQMANDAARAKRAEAKGPDLLGQTKTAKAKEEKTPTPILDWLEGKGKVRIGSSAAADLGRLGVTPKTHKSVFSRYGTVDALDGLDFTSFRQDLGDVVHLPGADTGDHAPNYVDKGALLDAIHDETLGKGQSSDAERLKGAEKQYYAQLTEAIDQSGADLLNDSTPDIKKALADYKAHMDAERSGGETFEQSSEGPRPNSLRSVLTEAASNLKQAKGSGDQILAALKNTSGVKEEEIAWTGLDDFLKGKKSITKQEVQDYLRDNQVQIKEVTLKDQHTQADEALLAELHDEQPANVAPLNPAIAGDTKHSKWQLPGGSNYREVLLTLPESRIPVEYVAGDTHERMRSTAPFSVYEKGKEANALNHVRLFHTLDKAQAHADELNSKGITRDTADNFYNTSHFDQPNILAHVRLNDRVDADGKKILFVEEVQSDWHQAGRKKGYKGDVEKDQVTAQKELADLEDALREKYKSAEGRWWFSITPEERAVFLTVKSRAEGKYQKSNHVPDAPFKKTWHEMAFRRVAQMAAQDGYDRVAWTTGEMQNDRFDLSKQIDALHVQRDSDGNYLLRADTQHGDRPIGERIPENKLEDYIGKDLAKKVIEDKIPPGTTKSKTYSGLDLKVGGEGMKGFYDKILPQYAGKFAKKFGGKVGETTINDGIKTIKDEDNYVDRSVLERALQISEADGEKRSIENINKALAILDEGKTIDDIPFNLMSSNSVDRALSEKAKAGTKVHSMDITPDMRKTANETGFEMFQGGNDPRGSLTIHDNGKAIMTLFEREDASTVLHELGHLYWNVLDKIGKLEGATDEVKADVAIMRQWVGAEDGKELTTEQHEKIADGFLSYIRSGEAPSAELQGAFDRFKGWLVRLYKGLRDTLPGINKNVVGVFDRMLATDEQIESMKDNPEFKISPEIMEMLGKTEGERYQRQINRWLESSKSKLLAKAMRQMDREGTADYKEKRAAIEKDMADHVNGSEPFRIIDAIKAAGGLNRKALIDLKGGKEILAYMPKGPDKVVMGKGGVDPKTLARLMNMKPTDMIDKIMGIETRKEMTQRLTNEEMIRRYGDMLHDGTLEREAVQKAHNEHHADVLGLELKAVADKARIVAPTREAIKAKAAKFLGDKAIRDVQPPTHYRAEVQSARAFGKALADKDYAKAAQYKAQELLNHHMFKMAIEAKADIGKQQAKWRRLIGGSDEEVSKVRSRVDPVTGEKLKVRLDIDYIYAARAILAKYGLGKSDYDFAGWFATVKDENPDLADSLSHAIEMWNNPPAATQRQIRNGRYAGRTVTTQPWRYMTLNDFHGLSDAVDNLIHAAEQQNVFTVNRGTDKEEKVPMQDVREATTGQIERFGRTSVKGTKEWDDKLKMAGLSLKNRYRRMEWLAKAIDGSDNGPWKKYIFDPVKDATNKFRDENEAWQVRLRDILEPISKNLHGDTIEAPELASQDEKGNELFSGVFKDKAELLGAIQHIGNASSRDKLLRGNNWDSDVFDAFTDRMYAEDVLTKPDMDAVQSIWNLYNELKPQAQRAMKEMHGYRFDEITAESFDTPFGQYKGGYAPAKTDRNKSRTADIRAQKEEFMTSGNAYMFPSTGRGFTHSRIEQFADPLELSLSLAPAHLESVLRFIHVEPAIRDVAKLFRNKDFGDSVWAVDRTLGKVMDGWLMRSARGITDVVPDRADLRLANSLAGWLRRQTGAAQFFLNVVNAPLHMGVLFPMRHRLGNEYMARAIWDRVTNRTETTDFVRENSAEIRHRGLPGEVTAQEAVRRMIDNRGVYTKFNDWQLDHAYVLQHLIWSEMDHMMWLGGYQKAMDGNVRDINGDDHLNSVRHADSLVRELQGSHHAEDISEMQATSPLAKLMQFWWGFFNNSGNVLMTRVGNEARGGGTVPQRAIGIASIALSYVAMQAIWADMTSGTLRGSTPAPQDYKSTPAWMLGMVEYLGAGIAHYAADLVSPVSASVFSYAESQIAEKIFHTKGMADHIEISPALQTLENSIKGPLDLVKAMRGEGHWSTALRELLGGEFALAVPASGAVRHPVAYLTKMREGTVRPQGPLDVGRGIIGGPRPSNMKQR